MATCPRAGRLFGRCAFKPRYERTPITPDQIEALDGVLESLGSYEIDALQGNRYVRDVCVRCGETRERPA